MVVAAWSVLALVSAAGAAPPLDSLDDYGGVVRGVAPATGYFQVKQVGDRWMFVTPDGNGMWMTGIFGVIQPDWVDDLGTSAKTRVVAKYGGEDAFRDNWRINTSRRLKLWGFNTLSAYHHWAMRAGLPDPNPEGIPYIHIINPARYAVTNSQGLGTNPVKDLIFGTDPAHHDGWRGSRQLDFFDPAFESYVDGWIRNDDGLKHGNIGNQWMVGIAMDEGDSLFGFGPGPEIPAPRLHTHPGLVALITNYEQKCNPFVAGSTGGECSPGTPYADRKVYTKYALRDFLVSRYGDIAALNAAWGTNGYYTAFDSDGGWGTGTGILDENGRNPWVGKWHDEMATGSPAVRADLDDFLYLYAQRYFTVMASKMRQYAPQHLVFGPTSLNNWGGLTRKPILRAAGESVDVLQATIGSPRALELTATYAGNKPIVTWDSFVANPDSALFRYQSPEDFGGDTRRASLQEERGQLYGNKVDFLFNALTPAGVHAVAGMTLWAWSDHWGEKANFGLVTLSDNAYDGQEAVVAPGTDAWGWPTGGEEKDYGDFLSAVSASHGRVRDWMKAIAFRPLPARALALFDPGEGAVTLVDSSDDVPPESAYSSYALTAPVSGQWVIGDWDGDGIDTPAVYGDNGAFFYTNDRGPTTNWTGIWFGFLGRQPVAGRFEATAAHDCLGVVDSAPWPGYGTAFALYSTCDLTSGEDPPKTVQWIGPILADSGGFTGVHQFATGDFDGDGVETVALRRGVHVAWTNVPPTTLMGEFGLAQYVGAPGVGEGRFVTGDWDGDGLDSFGLFYPDGSFYRRNDLEWNSGLYTVQRINQPIGTAVTVTSWRPGP